MEKDERVVFPVSATARALAPSLPILLLFRKRCVRAVFPLSFVARALAPSLPISFPFR